MVMTRRTAAAAAPVHDEALPRPPSVRPVHDKPHPHPLRLSLSSLPLIVAAHTLNFVLLTLPDWLLRFSSIRALSTAYFGYNTVQTLALYWIFLLDIIYDLTIRLGQTLADEHAPSLLGGPSGFIFSCATTVTTLSILRLLMGVGQAFWGMATESAEDFPVLRKRMRLFKHPEQIHFRLLFGVLLLMIATTALLLITPWLCEGLSEGMCDQSVLRFFGPKHRRPRHIIGLVLVVLLFQWLTVLAFTQPDWHKIFSSKNAFAHWHRSMAAFSIILCLLLIVSIGVGLSWCFTCFITVLRPWHPFGDNPADAHETAGNLVLLSWECWLMVFLLWIYKTEHTALLHKESYRLKANTVVQAFRRLKLIFFSTTVGAYILAVLHADGGATEAQDALTLMTLTLPLVYTVGLHMVQMFLQVRSIRHFAESLVMAVAVAGILCKLSFSAGHFACLCCTLVLLNIIFGQGASNSKPASHSSDHKPRFRTCFSHIVTVALALTVCVTGVCLLMSLASHWQQTKEGHTPALFKWQYLHSDEPNHGGTLKINHALVSKLTLGIAHPPEGGILQSPHPYSGCGLRFHDLDLIDLGLMAMLAYDDSKEKQVLLDLVLGPGFKIGASRAHTSGQAQFTEIVTPNNVTVVSVRGTDLGRIEDFLTDIRIFSAPVLFSILSTIFPTIALWPDATSALVLQNFFQMKVQLFGIGLQKDDGSYVRSILDFVKSIPGPPSNVLLVGHSLGGALAHSVAHLTAVQSVAFSPPGVAWNSFRFQSEVGGGRIQGKKISIGELHLESVSVVPDTDIFPLVDVQKGLTQRIRCKSSGFNSCHMVESTLCTLIQSCGSKRFKDCQFNFGLTDEVEDAITSMAHSLRSSDNIREIGVNAAATTVALILLLLVSCKECFLEYQI